MIGFDGQMFPRASGATVPKELIKPISGQYADYEIVEYEGTSEEGVYSFSELLFSEAGNAGEYKVRVSCEGQHVDTGWIRVQSKVEEVRVLEFTMPRTRFMSISEFEDEFKPKAQVVSRNKSGVALKGPKLRVHDALKAAVSWVSVVFDAEDLRALRSDAEGLMSMGFKVKNMTAAELGKRVP